MQFIDHATLYTPDDVIADGAILIDGGHIVACGPAAEVAAPASAAHIDAQGATVAPGFIDLQLNGALGDDFTDAVRKAYDAVGRISFEGCFFRKDIGFKALKHVSRGTSAAGGRHNKKKS